MLSLFLLLVYRWMLVNQEIAFAKLFNYCSNAEIVTLFNEIRFKTTIEIL